MTLYRRIEVVREALKFYADPKSFEMIHGTASYMPIEVDDGYKAREALSALPEPMGEDEILQIIRHWTESDTDEDSQPKCILADLKSAGVLLVKEG